MNYTNPCKHVRKRASDSSPFYILSRHQDPLHASQSAESGKGPCTSNPALHVDFEPPVGLLTHIRRATG